MRSRWFAKDLAYGAIAAVLSASSVCAQDVQATIKEAENALGMIRGVARVDAINTMEYWGTGADYRSLAFTPGRPDPLPNTVNYHASLSYAVPAMRVDVTGTMPPPPRRIQVVSGRFSWDESVPGGGFMPGTTATPMPAELKTRSLQLWTLPFGALKAAVKAGVSAKVTTEAGATVITFLLPDPLSNVTAKVTLNAKKQVERVETRTSDPKQPELNTEMAYSDYKDISEVPTDVLFPTHIVQKRSGTTVLELTITKTDTTNPYVVFPVPENVEKAARP